MSAPRASLRRRLRRRWKRRPGLVPWLVAAPQRVLIALLALVPVALAGALARALGGLVWLSPKRRALGRAHLALAFPEAPAAQRDRWLRAACRHLGWMAYESTVLARRHGIDWLEPRSEFEPGARELLAGARGQAAIFVAAHVGSVAALAGTLGLFGLHPAMPIRPPGNYYLMRDLLAGYARAKVEVLSRDGAVRAMLRALRERRAVLIEADQNAHHQPIFVPWFGRLAATERSPAGLRLHTGAAVYVAWAVVLPGRRWRIGCRQLEPAGARVPVTGEATTALTARLHTALEDVVRRHPEQYLWIHDRYRTRPRPEPT